MSIQITRGFCLRVATLSTVAMIGALVCCAKTDDEYASVARTPASQAEAVQTSIAIAQAGLGRRTGAVAADGGAMFGRPANAAGALPPAKGAPHLYHLGADTFFLGSANKAGLTSEQQKTLQSLKERAATAYATAQREIDQGEQDLWVLSSSETPDLAKIEAKIEDISRVTARQRVEFIRTVGEAVGVLSEAQRQAVTSQGRVAPPAVSTPGVADAGPPVSQGMPGMTDAGTPAGMGHM